MACKFVSYLRVSTDKQGNAGNGLEAQRATVQGFAVNRGCQIIAEYVEVESGRKSDRPQLQAAIEKASITGATLIIAKLDRLTRNVPFLYKLRDDGVDFLACDMEHANKMMLNTMVNIAEWEAEAISKRTREALAAKKARELVNNPAFKLGGPLGSSAFGNKVAIGQRQGAAKTKAIALEHATRLAATIADIRAEGIMSLSKIATALNERGIKTTRKPRKGDTKPRLWHPTSVARLLSRLPVTQA